ncbi:uncharacterized protein F5891DRAFT_1198524 [Suillus fuscotomentosus]|uniref:Uncharacterized protein n=1 Tax=Suillus fuscotomentosus TaxID=1912939 RepID=A0AAD4DQ78_9AGAM|nr:uncharacterized protein F5891DRAFT_1198524 [Suillus fuscotomentosus]KAG1889651.1 hypothetical protein F5891DRAFT_1198524 [Suillus fuscotomentosus]
MDVDDANPATQPTFLGDYDLDDSLKLQALDDDSDLEPPPLAQKHMSRSIFPDFDLPVVSQKRKISPLRDDDDLLISSEVEIVGGIKNEPTEPVPMRRLTSTTNVTATLKAPPAKWVKSESSGTMDPPHIIAAPSRAMACSAYRKKHLPQGCQDGNKWAREFIPTIICYIGDQDEVWTLSDDILCPILQSIWNVVYKTKTPHTVEADGAVIALTLQHLSEWRNTISNVALVILTNFMSSQGDLKTDQCYALK